MKDSTITPEYLRKVAENSSQSIFIETYNKLKAEAEKGYTSCILKGVPETVITHLKEKGFNVTEGFMNKFPGITAKNKEYTVSF